MEDLNGKNILLFVPGGKGIYGTGISGELIRQGAMVEVFDERPSKSTLFKIFLRISRKSVEPLLLNYYFRILNKFRDKKFDYCLFIRAEGLTPRCIRKIRYRLGSTKFILYLWDSLKNNNTKSLFRYFDKILTFDHVDAENNPGLIHRPLFYLPEYRQASSINTRETDVIFIGKIHDDRYGFLMELKKTFKKNQLRYYFYFYFPGKLMYYRKKISDRAFKHSKINEFHFKMLGTSEVADKISLSKASVDIEGKNQHGLTMRTIEILGAKRKFITTNESIKLYDFFDSRNILVVDRVNPVIEMSFIENPFIEIPVEIYQKYSIETWIDEVFTLDGIRYEYLHKDC